MYNPVGWFEIYVNDMDRAKAFYETVFATPLTHLETPSDINMWVFSYFQENYGASGALVKMEGCAAGQMGGTLVYFHSEDCSIEESRVEAAGGRIFKAKESIGPHGFISLITDTEGNMIGLHSMK